MHLLLVGFAFATGFLMVFGGNLLIADVGEAKRQRDRERIIQESRLRQRERARNAAQFEGLSRFASEQSREINARESLTKQIKQWFDQSGRRVRPAQIAGTSLILATVPAIIVGFGLGNVLMGMVLMPLAAALPVVWVMIARKKRLARIQEQLPDAFDLMSRTLRAGQTMSQALQSVADEAGPPLADEFLFCHEQQELGMSPESALEDLAYRTGLLEIRIFVLAVSIHRQTGGNLSELLTKLATLLRERERTRGLIKSLTAEGQMQAFILLALPFLVMGMMAVINRAYLTELFSHPGLLVAMAGLLTVGMFWMRSIVNFDY